MTKLYPLEVKCVMEVTNRELNDVPVDIDDEHIILEGTTENTERPTRKAADTGILIRRLAGHT